MRTLLFLICHLTSCLANAQLAKSIDLNISLNDTHKFYFYQQIKPYEKENYIYLLNSSPWGDTYKGYIILLKNSGKVKKIVELIYDNNDSTNRLIYPVTNLFVYNKIDLFAAKKQRKLINQYLKLIEWNKYNKEPHKNYFWRDSTNNKEEKINAINDIDNTIDGVNKTIILKINAIIKIINLYQWYEFVKICDLKTHKYIEELHMLFYKLNSKKEIKRN